MVPAGGSPCAFKSGRLREKYSGECIVLLLKIKMSGEKLKQTRLLP